MIFGIPENIIVYLKPGKTDMRKSINGLSLLVEQNMELDPFSGNYFVFCNKRRNIIKLLYWDRNGFSLWYKRLEEHKFKWPRTEEELMEIDTEQLSWLMRGLDFGSAHQKLKYSKLD
jgi:transposase